jgi:hypothetical protein
MRLEKILCTVLQEAYERLEEETIYLLSSEERRHCIYAPNGLVRKDP